ncbi:helix-turn-helix transcriptional regulator [Castellaniella caeni]|uniref:helix-turn-helix transcriptional regulator n=1 Tax=Castellaniella caeni TaxID=266123 RepID=UPI000836B9D3|nr:WYL domain-containing protein [Castellaniella caeni]
MADQKSTKDILLFNLELLRRIPPRSKITARELHEELRDAGFDRNLRTVQRQLDMLSQHFELDRDDSSKPYGYRWRPNAKGLSLPSLTVQESLLLKLAQEQLRYLLPPSLMRSMESFFKHATETLISSDAPDLERQWRKKVRVVSTSQPLLPPAIDQAVFDTVSDALYRNRWLSLDYRNARQTLRQAQRAMPLGLAQQGPRLYLVCRYRGYDNERSLALNRIQAAHMLADTFTRPASFDLKDYDEDGRFGFGEGIRIRLSFSIDRQAGYHLLESPLSTDQVVTEQEGGYRIEATVVDSLMLEQWLRGFGDKVWGIVKMQMPVAAAES